MAGWASLAASVIKTEFPQFETAQSFRVFTLNSDSRAADLDAIDVDFRRLAKTFGLDADVLNTEFASLCGIAQHMFQSEGCANFRDAWCRAISRVTSHCKLRERYPAQTVGELLRYYCVWIVSTSGVERNFSVCKWLRGINARAQMNPQRELDELQLMTFEDDAQQASVIEIAQGLWLQLYGISRRARGMRLRGFSRKPESAKSGARVMPGRHAQEEGRGGSVAGVCADS